MFQTMTPQIKLLFFAKSFVLLSCLRLGLPQDIEVERLKAEIQIDDLELVDACSNIAQAKKTAIVSQNFYQKVSDLILEAMQVLIYILFFRLLRKKVMVLY